MLADLFQFQISIFAIVFIALLPVSITVAYYAWKHHLRNGSIQKITALIIVFGIIWVSSDFLALIFLNFDAIVICKKIAFASSIIVPTLLLIFSVQCTQKNRLLSRSILSVMIIPFLSSVLILTNELHNLLWKSIELNLGNHFIPLVFIPGEWFQIFRIYAYGCILFSILFFAYSKIHINVAYHRRIDTLIIIMLFPFVSGLLPIYYEEILSTTFFLFSPEVANIIKNTLNSFQYYDPTPFLFLIFVLIMPVTISRLEIGKTIPGALDEILNGIDDGILVINLEGKIASLNLVCQKIFSKSLSEVVGKKLSEISIDLDRDISKDTKKESEKTFVLNNIHYNLRIYPFVDWINRQQGKLIILRDITEQKKVEEERQRLTTAFKMMEMKDNFISSATHELKTPIVSIKGYVDLILSRSINKVPNEVMSNLYVVQRNTERLLNLLNDLLDIRRIESGKINLNLESLDFKKNLDFSVEEIKPFIEEKKQKLILEMPDEPLMVKGDYIRLNQILVNLLSNANKFSPEDREIRIDTKIEDDFVKVQISDQGIGIREEDMDRIFEPFADIKKPNYYKGTGLGLSVTKGLVEMHGGKIWVESPELAQGAIFTFTLPLVKND